MKGSKAITNEVIKKLRCLFISVSGKIASIHHHLYWQRWGHVEVSRAKKPKTIIYKLIETSYRVLENNMLTLFDPAYLSISRNQGGGTLYPLNILVLGGVRVPILFGIDLLWNDVSFSKGFRKF